MRDGIWESSDLDSARNENDFPFIDHNSKEVVLEWLVNDFEDKVESRSDRLEIIARLDSMFEGEPYTVGGSRKGDLDDDKRVRSSIFNYANEMVEAKMSQRSRFKTSIQVIPSKVEAEDEFKAECVKTILKAKAQEKGLDALLAKGDKEMFIAGEQYTYIPWDKYAGGMTTVVDDSGFTSEPFYRGDFEVKVLGPDKCFHQLNKTRWDDVDDCSIVEWVHIDELKSDYPDSADDLLKGNSSQYEDSLNRDRYGDNYVMVITYYRRPTRFLTSGAYYKFCYGAVLEGELEYPYRDKDGLPLIDLPIVYDTDIDLRGKLGGKPFLSNIEKLQRLHDMLSSSAARGFAIGSSPKWLYPKGAVDPNKLGNNYATLEYKGPVKPELVSYTAIPQGSDMMMSAVERGIEKGSAVFGGARGEPPRGVKAAVALQFLNEQETQRESYGMSKRQERAQKIYKMMLQRAQQFYTPEDGRIFKYVGDDNSYLVQAFEKMDISGDFDITFENSSSLPDSKSGRIASIIDLNQATPNDPMFDRNQISQMLDLGNDKRFRNEAQASLKAAQTKLQRILAGGESEPREWDDLTTEYPIFVKALRERAFKGASPEIEQKLKDYIKGLEGLIWQKSLLSPAYKERIVMSIPEYPIFLKLPLQMPPQQEKPQQGMPQPQAVTEMPSLQQEE